MKRGIIDLERKKKKITNFPGLASALDIYMLGKAVEFLPTSFPEIGYICQFSTALWSIMCHLKCSLSKSAIKKKVLGRAVEMHTEENPGFTCDV